MAKIEWRFQDEQGSNLNRYIATNVATGEEVVFDLLRGGVVNVVGTPLNADTLNSLIDAINQSYDEDNIIIDKALYNLGAYDTISGNVITRRTGYINKDNITSYGTNSPYPYPTFYIRGDFISNINNVSNIKSNKSITLYDLESDIVSVSYTSYFNSQAELDQFIRELEIQYETKTLYTEEIIENQPLITLDSQGSKWLTDEWKKGINLLNPSLYDNRTEWNTSGNTDTRFYILLFYKDTYVWGDIACEFQLGINSPYGRNNFTFSVDGRNNGKLYGVIGINGNNQDDKNLFEINLSAGTYTYSVFLENASINRYNVKDFMISKGKGIYDYQPYNSNKHITNQEANFLKEDFKASANLIDYENRLIGKGINGNTGQLQDDNNYYTTQFISVKPNTTYSMSGVQSYWIYYYDTNYNFIGSYENTPFTTPSNCYYIRKEISVGFTTPMLNEGSNAYDYEPYDASKHISNEEAQWLKDEWEKGLQLFDKNNAKYGTGWDYDSQASDWVKVYDIPVKPNTTYSINVSANVSLHNGSDYTTSNTSTFTTNSDTIKIAICVYVGSGASEEVARTTFANLTLVKGRKAYSRHDYNANKHITNFEAEFLKEESLKSGQLWNEKWESGSLGNSGEKVDNVSMIRSVDFISVKPNTTYTINTNSVIWGYDSGKGSIGELLFTNGFTFTTPSNCYYLRFRLSSDYGTTYKNDVMLNKGSTAQPYHEFEGSIVRSKEFDDRLDEMQENMNYSHNIVVELYRELRSDIDNMQVVLFEASSYANAPTFTSYTIDVGVTPDTYQGKVLEVQTTLGMHSFPLYPNKFPDETGFMELDYSSNGLNLVWYETDDRITLKIQSSSNIQRLFKVIIRN